MKKEHATRLASLSGFGLVAALVIATPAAMAQETAKPIQPPAPAALAAPVALPSPASQPPQPGQEEIVEAEELVYAPLQVGDATQSLLAWQRSGEIASPTPRPIAGNVASRSYDRYIKTFEFPIPERMSSIVKSGSASGGSK